MKFTLILWAVLFGFMLLAAPNAQAEDAIEVQHPYAFATATVQKNGAAFFTLISHSEEADKLITASADIADKVELHTHLMDGDMMMMREVEGYDIAPGAIVELQPMGHHIMLMGLHNKLELGTSFPLTLTFEKAGERVVDVQVIAPGTKPDISHDHH